MDRKLKLAAVSLVALTATACAPNPYWGTGGSSSGTYYNGNRSTTSAPAANAVTHTHCGRTHSHVLPPEGLAHQHGDGCMAGAGGVATAPQTYTAPQNYNYNPPPATNNYYNPPPVTTGTSTSGTYGYTDPGSTTYYNYGTPSTGSTSGSYYEYTAPKPSTGTSSTSTGSSYSGSTTSAPAYSGDSYVVQKGDTVFQVMRNTGVYWKDIIRLNNLQAPNYSISAGQKLKLK